MKFKMPKSKTTQSEVDRKAEQPGASSWADSDASKVASPYFGANERSGIYDPSRIIKAPPPHAAVRFADSAKRSRSNSETARAVLIAAALPLTAAAVFLLLSGQDTGVTQLGLDPQGSVSTAHSDSSTESKHTKTSTGPVAKATLPVLNPTPIQTQAVSSNTLIRQPSSSAGGTTAPSSANPIGPVAHPAANPVLVFNEYGELDSPYTLVFDENGNITSAQTRAEALAIFPTLDFRVNGRQFDIKVFAPSKEFKPQNPAIVINRIYDSMRKLYSAKTSDPDAMHFIENLQKTTMARSNVPVATLKSFAPHGGSLQADALIELSWLKKAALYQRITGDKQLALRIDHVLRTWAQTFEPSGEIESESPLTDYVYAYSLMRNDSQKETVFAVDRFLTRLIEQQFEHLRLNKFYDTRHAMFVANTIAVGVATGNIGYQWYGLERFNQHVANSPAFNRPGLPTRADIDTYARLLEAMMQLDQSTVLKDFPKSVASMASYLDRLLIGVQNPNFAAENKASLAEALKQAVYFRPTLLPLYARMQTLAGGLNDDERLARHGSVDALLNLTRRYPDSMAFAESGRTPSAAPRVLPQKAPQR
ncbi:MAG: hypothetical protein JNJ49_01970 [Bdellovibrionaceae bacterium]|nr:hypothetical protein [Pseudobdellovibrionaceae bacterium]